MRRGPFPDSTGPKVEEKNAGNFREVQLCTEHFRFPRSESRNESVRSGYRIGPIAYSAVGSIQSCNMLALVHGRRLWLSKLGVQADDVMMQGKK